MSGKMNIGGKEYTQRGVSTLEINGKTEDGGVVPTDSYDGCGHINITINLSEDYVEVNEQDLPQVQSIESTSEDIDNNIKIDISEVIEKEEAKSWISKILQYIKNIFKKN